MPKKHRDNASEACSAVAVLKLFTLPGGQTPGQYAAAKVASQIRDLYANRITVEPDGDVHTGPPRAYASQTYAPPPTAVLPIDTEDDLETVNGPTLPDYVLPKDEPPSKPDLGGGRDWTMTHATNTRSNVSNARKGAGKKTGKPKGGKKGVAKKGKPKVKAKVGGKKGVKAKGKGASGGKAKAKPKAAKGKGRKK